MEELANIYLGDEFTGESFSNYEVYESEARTLLSHQRHIDIRPFTGLEEKWVETAGHMKVGPLSAIKNLPGMELEFTEAGTKTAESHERQLDIETNFEPTDIISFSLPSFPLKAINTTTSFIDFTSNAEGNFTTGPTVSLSFSSSIVTLSEGNTEFRVERKSLESNELDLKAISAVRFRVTATEATKVIIAGLRLLASTWKNSLIDYNNWDGQLRTPISAYSLEAKAWAQPMPILWRCANPPGLSDPAPVDAEFQTIFYTGAQEKENSLTLYFRESSRAFLTQLDLDATPQSELDGKPQPDLGVSEWAGRPMSDLDRISMEEMDRQSMYELERVADPVYTGWIYFTLTWGANKKITISNSSDTGYEFSHPNLKNDSTYIFFCSLNENTARASIYEFSEGKIGAAPIFDTKDIEDDFLFKRRKGRFGWTANLLDGNAYLSSIRPREVCFAEYKSLPLKSITPVRGAQLFGRFSEDEELFVDFLEATTNTSQGSSISRDISRTLSGESYRVDVYGTANQGLETNWMTINDFANSSLSFDIWYPNSSILEAKEKSEKEEIEVKLISKDGATIVVPLPLIYHDQWQHIRLSPIINSLASAGEYRLSITQPSAASGSWWIDNAEIKERSIQWDARSVADNPWKTNYAPWTEFGDVFNDQTQGILFSERGKDLQLRGRALKQNASVITPPNLKPSYAQLGKLVWPENALTRTEGPTANFTHSEKSELTFDFTSTSTPVSKKLSEHLFGTESTYTEEAKLSAGKIENITPAGVVPFKSGTLENIYIYTGKTANTCTSFKVRLLNSESIELASATYASKPGTNEWIHVSGIKHEVKAETTYEITVEPIGGELNISKATEVYYVRERKSNGFDFIYVLKRKERSVWAYYGTGEITTTTADIVLTEWSFGDGDRGLGESVEHTYAASGEYDVTLAVTDRNGLIGEKTELLVV